MARNRRLELATIMASLIAAASSCGGRRDQDAQLDEDRRNEWLRAETDAKKLYVQAVLNGTTDIQYYDGWWNLERDPRTGGAWRWMEKRGVLRLRTKPGGATETHDMEMHVFGWVPYEHLAERQYGIDFIVNGHIVEHFTPPATAFEHVVVVPRSLLGGGDWIDFTIAVTSVARVAGDGRDLGFATTGFQWKPVPPS
ncbi:MAG: hypothetical protein JWP87_5005 [Labilithrix sp.]|jgi:hypothetical protein|nr:hypothetical protein [Labilithrix sp.]